MRQPFYYLSTGFWVYAGWAFCCKGKKWSDWWCSIKCFSLDYEEVRDQILPLIWVDSSAHINFIRSSIFGLLIYFILFSGQHSAHSRPLELWSFLPLLPQHDLGCWVIVYYPGWVWVIMAGEVTVSRYRGHHWGYKLDIHKGRRTWLKF